MQNDLAIKFSHSQDYDQDTGKFTLANEQHHRRDASPVAQIFSLRNRTARTRVIPTGFARLTASAAHTENANIHYDHEPIPRPRSRFAVKLPSSDDDVFSALDGSGVAGDPVHMHVTTPHAPAQSAPSTVINPPRKQEVASFTGGHRLSSRFTMPKHSFQAQRPTAVVTAAAESVQDDTKARHRQSFGHAAYDLPESRALSSRTSQLQTPQFGPTESPSIPRGGTVEPKHEIQEDMSTIMIRGAADLRNTKLEVEGLRREVAILQEQLAIAEQSKEESLQRIQTIKDATKKSLESSVRSLDEFKMTMEGLKSQSHHSFDFVNQIRTSLVDVEELRGAVADSTNTMQSLLDENGELVKVTEAKELLAELQNEIKQSQHVSELLRERLQAVGAELIDAKARVTELETMQVADREALRQSAGGLAITTERVGEMSQQLKEHQGRLYDMLSTAADVHAELSITQQETKRLNEVLLQKDVQIEQLRQEQLEVSRLQVIVTERDLKIAAFQEMMAQLDIATKQCHEQHAQISGYVAEVTAKDELISDLKTRLEQLDEAVKNDTQEQNSLRERLSVAQVKESSYERELERMQKELNLTKAQINHLESALEETRGDLTARNEKLSQSNNRYQILEERFEDQSITLKITKDAHGDLQERVLESESRFARELEAVTGKLSGEVAVLNEHKASMQDKVLHLDATIEDLKLAAAETKVEHDRQVIRQDAAHQAALEHERERTTAAEKELQSLRAREQTKAAEVLDMTNRIHDLNTQLREAQTVLTDTQVKDDSQISELKLQVDQLQTENTDLNERSRFIESRYRSGDLDSHERAFINNLVKTTQSVHEQELVTKGNDLRRRDNTILELRSKISILESTLSKHLKSQAKIHATAGIENRSLIDPATWASSDRGSSPTTGPPILRPVSEREMSLNLAAKTPAVVRRPKPAIVPTSVHVTPLPARTPAPNRLPPALKTMTAPAGPVGPASKASQPNKTRFTKLARNSSDQASDVEEFEPPVCRDRSPIRLGKRDERPPPSPADVEVALKPAKRLRASTRTTRSSTKLSEEGDLKELDKGTTKRIRRRR